MKNRAFAGEIRHRDAWLPGAHEPVLDADLLAAAQALLNRRATAAGPSPAALRGEFVLTGLVSCGRCGGSYVGTSGTSKTKVKVRYYSCGTARKYGAKTCAGPSLPAEELEELVTEALLEVYRDNALFDEAIAKHLVEQETTREPLEHELAALRTSLANKQRILGRYRDDYEAARISAERYEARSVELEEDVAALTARAAALEARLGTVLLPTAPSVEQLAAMRRHLVHGVRHADPRLRKAVLNALVAGLEVHERDDIRPTFRLYDAAATGQLADGAKASRSPA